MPLLGVANEPTTSNFTVLDVHGNLRVRNNLFLHAFDGVDRGIFFRGNEFTNAFEHGGVSKYNLSLTTYDDSGGGTSADGLSLNAYDGIRFLTDDSTTPKLRIPRTGGLFIGNNQLCDATGKIISDRLGTGVVENAWVVRRVADGTIALQIGAYAMCIHRTLNQQIIADFTYSGSLLSQGYTVNLNSNTSGGWYPVFGTSTLVGTWRAMNDSFQLPSGSWHYGGLFLRIA
jgi:hypothetical protein